MNNLVQVLESIDEPEARLAVDVDIDELPTKQLKQHLVREKFIELYEGDLQFDFKKSSASFIDYGERRIEKRLNLVSQQINESENPDIVFGKIETFLPFSPLGLFFKLLVTVQKTFSYERRRVPTKNVNYFLEFWVIKNDVECGQTQKLTARPQLIVNWPPVTQPWFKQLQAIVRHYETVLRVWILLLLGRAN